MAEDLKPAVRDEVTVRGTIVELSRQHPDHSWVRFTMDPLKVEFGRYVLLPNSLLSRPSPEMREAVALEPGDLEWLDQVLRVEHQHWPGALQPLTEWQEAENARIDRILAALNSPSSEGGGEEDDPPPMSDETVSDLRRIAAEHASRAQGQIPEGWREALEEAADTLDDIGYGSCGFHCEREGGYDNTALVAHLRAMIAAAPQAPAVTSGWRPIETAPKDGTPILAFNPVVGVYNTAFTTWFDCDENKMRKPGYEGFPCGFWFTGKDCYPFGQWDCQPTHWQPSPDPPSLPAPPPEKPA